ncbi:MAG: hypothetical protein AAF846_27980 [Chloroflexota bacterium]
MKIKFTRMTFFLLALSLLFSLNQDEVLAQNNNESRHIIIVIDGQANYRDVNWGNDSWQPLSVGLPIQSSWLIAPVGPSTVTVLCSDGTFEVLSGTTSNSGCNNTGASFTSQLDIEDLIRQRGTRGDNEDANQVTILTPIDRISTTTPFISWTPSQDFDTYLISILDNGLPVDGGNVTVTGETFYQMEPDILERGKAYDLRVAPVSSTNETQFTYRDTINVSILPEADYAEFAQIRQLFQDVALQLATSEQVSVYAEAWAFYEFSLFSEAEMRLKDLITPDVETESLGNPNVLEASPYPYIVAGDSSLFLGQDGVARDYYNKALASAQTIEDYWIMAVAVDRLATLEDEANRQVCYRNHAQSLREFVINNTDVSTSLADC